MTNKHSINDLYQMQALSLASKIQMSKARIRAWIEKYGEDGVYVSFSGGKDSTVLLDLVVTFKKRSTYEIPSYAGWGTDTVGINVFRDDAGNCFIWKSTSAFFNIAEGSQVRLRGTVKEHSDYKGTKQTILQRCKVDAVKL